MTVLFLVFFNIFVAAIIYLALSLKLTRITQSNLQKKLQDEFRAIIDEFNQTAETNISLLERRLQQVNSALNRARQMPLSETSAPAQFKAGRGQEPMPDYSHEAAPTIRGEGGPSHVDHGNNGFSQKNAFQALEGMGGMGSLGSGMVTNAFGLDVTLDDEELDYLLTDKGLPHSPHADDSQPKSEKDPYAQAEASVSEPESSWAQQGLEGPNLPEGDSVSPESRAHVQALQHKRESLGLEAASPSLGERLLDGLVAMEAKAVFAVQKWFQGKGAKGEAATKEGSPKSERARPIDKKAKEAWVQQSAPNEGEGGEDPLERQSLIKRIAGDEGSTEATAEVGGSARLKQEIDNNLAHGLGGKSVDFWSEEDEKPWEVQEDTFMSSGASGSTGRELTVMSDSAEQEVPEESEGLEPSKMAEKLPQDQDLPNTSADFGEAERLIRSDLGKIRDYLAQSRQKQQGSGIGHNGEGGGQQARDREERAPQGRARLAPEADQSDEKPQGPKVSGKAHDEKSEERVVVLNEDTATLPADFWQRSRDERVGHIAQLLHQGYSVKDLSALTNMSFGEIELIASLNKKPV